MKNISQMTELVLVNLGEGVIAQVEVTETGREKVGTRILSFDLIGKTISRISQVIAEPIQNTKPTKATVKYGIALGIEEGSLVATLVRGSGTASIEVTLEWENKPKSLPS